MWKLNFFSALFLYLTTVMFWVRSRVEEANSRRTSNIWIYEALFVVAVEFCSVRLVCSWDALNAVNGPNLSRVTAAAATALSLPIISSPLTDSAPNKTGVRYLKGNNFQFPSSHCLINSHISSEWLQWMLWDNQSAPNNLPDVSDLKFWA